MGYLEYLFPGDSQKIGLYLQIQIVYQFSYLLRSLEIL